MAGHERKYRPRCTRASAFAVGHACNGARRVFAFKRRGPQFGRVRVFAIVGVNVREIAFQQAVLRR